MPPSSGFDPAAPRASRRPSRAQRQVDLHQCTPALRETRSPRHEDGMVLLRGRLDPEAGVLMRRALEAVREAL